MITLDGSLRLTDRRDTFNRHSRIGLLALVGAVFLSTAATAQSNLPSGIQALLPQAKNEGTVSLQLGIAVTEAEGRKFGQVFSDRMGIPLKVVLPGAPESAGALAQKIAAAFKSGIKPSIDVFPQSEAAIAVMRESGMVETVDWKSLGVPAEKISQFGDSVLTFVFPTTTIYYNTNLVKGDDIPKTHKDLLNPKWKGKLVAVPRGIAHLGLSLIMGEKEALGFIKQVVDTQDVSWSSNPVAALQKVGSGEALIGFGTLPWLKAFPNIPVKVATLDKVAGAPYKNVVLKSQEGHTAAAKLLVYFMCCTPEGQKAFYELTQFANFNTPDTIPGEIGANGRGIVYSNDFDVNIAPKLAVEFDKALGVR